LVAAAAPQFGALQLVRLEKLSGGQSGNNFAAELVDDHGESHQMVLRAATPGLAAVKNRDVLRQARILRALAATPVPVPLVLFEDAGRNIDEPPFFAMQFSDGDAFEPTVDSRPDPPDEPTLAQRALAAARVLGILHAVDPRTIGIDEEKAVSLDDEVWRWRRVLDTVDSSLRQSHDRCADLLLAQLPQPEAAAIVHGDYRLGNVLCVGVDVSAVIDWEIWTIGDPRLDLAWFLAITRTWGNPYSVRAVPGLPGRDELEFVYEVALGKPLAREPWFDAHTRFKQAAIMAQLVKHNRRRAEPDPYIEEKADASNALLSEAIELVT
jgi:aminoglycoside phosphotransferase (APT) family kinase protein